jgi:hypothetical protein
MRAARAAANALPLQGIFFARRATPAFGVATPASPHQTNDARMCASGQTAGHTSFNVNLIGARWRQLLPIHNFETEPIR